MVPCIALRLFKHLLSFVQWPVIVPQIRFKDCSLNSYHFSYFVDCTSFMSHPRKDLKAKAIIVRSLVVGDEVLLQHDQIFVVDLI